MRNTTILGFVVLFVVAADRATLAQPPLPPAGTAQRLPDDNVEGTIFEYKGALKVKPKEGEEAPNLEGKFSIEDSAILDVSPTFKLPTKEDVKKLTDQITQGKGADVKLPAAPQQKRLGQYRRISKGKMRLDFNDKDSLQGVMVLALQKNTSDVWIGTFTEKLAKDGKKSTRIWQVEVRPIED
jgi:hypothetical protein